MLIFVSLRMIICVLRPKYHIHISRSFFRKPLTHGRHPITRPYVRGIGRLMWVGSLIPIYVCIVTGFWTCCTHYVPGNRGHSAHALSQWATTLHCNAVSHRLGASTKWPPGNIHVFPGVLRCIWLCTDTVGSSEVTLTNMGYISHRSSRTNVRNISKAQQNHVHTLWGIR